MKSSINKDGSMKSSAFSQSMACAAGVIEQNFCLKYCTDKGDHTMSLWSSKGRTITFTQAIETMQPKLYILLGSLLLWCKMVAICCFVWALGL